MTIRELKLEALQAATEAISVQAYEDLEDQAKLVAANMLLLIGDKAVITATGFVYCSIQLHTAALAWALVQGYITLTDKAQASDEEMALRKTQRDSQDISVAVTGTPPKQFGAGGYV
jgi:hypothetical protein